MKPKPLVPLVGRSHQLDAALDAIASEFQARTGHVDDRRVQAALGQPDGVPPRAAGQVKGAAAPGQDATASCAEI